MKEITIQMNTDAAHIPKSVCTVQSAKNPVTMLHQVVNGHNTIDKNAHVDILIAWLIVKNPLRTSFYIFFI